MKAVLEGNLLLNQIVFDRNIVAGRFNFTYKLLFNHLEHLVNLVLSGLHFNKVNEVSSCEHHKTVLTKELCGFFLVFALSL